MFNTVIITGYDVKAETVLFINNHELSMSEKYWGEDANTFRASRFLVPRDNSNNVASDKTSSSDAGDLVFRRPSHFKPFSLGKRACMGYKIVEHMTLVLLVALFKNYDLCIDEKSSKIDIQGGMLALPLSPMELNLRRRSS
jgi:cytochrome P450